MPTRDYWGRRDTTGAPRPPDKCAELIQLGGVDTGHGLVPPLCVARLVRRDVGHSQVVVRGAYERAASLPPLRVEVRAAVGPDRLVFPPCVDCGGPVALSVEALPACRDCRSLFDWGQR